MSSAVLEPHPGIHTPRFGPFRAVLLREFRGALVNRYIQVFAVLALAGGLAVQFTSESTAAAGFLLLQITLYFVSLFAVLVGTSAARAETEEWPLLFAQPCPRTAVVWGKFIAIWTIFAGMLAVLFAPTVIAATPADALTVVPLYLRTLLLAAVFGSLGLAAGFLAHDRVQGLITGVAVWLALLFGIDLLALVAAQLPAFQKFPDLWVGTLMFNPLDAFRIQALFAMDQIPAETADKTALAHWWIHNAGLWFGILCAGWMAALLCLGSFRLNRWED